MALSLGRDKKDAALLDMSLHCARWQMPTWPHPRCIHLLRNNPRTCRAEGRAKTHLAIHESPIAMPD
jgi:hypothetical protein